MLRFLFGRPRTVRVPIDKSNVEVQQVKVTKHSKPIVGRFILTCVITSILIQGVKRWDPLGTYAQRDVLQEELERVKKEAQREHGDRYGKHWDKQHAQMKQSHDPSLPAGSTHPGAVRMTVPIWLRKGHQRMYMETDPEWKEFVKLQSDPKRIEQIKRQIGESVMNQIRDTSRNKFELSVIKFNGKVGVALEVVPQVFTPPIYEVPCLWLTTQSVDVGWRPLPPQTGAKMERIFRPVVLFEASTAAVRVFLYMTYAVTKAKVLNALGQDKSARHKSVITMPKIPSQPENSSEKALAEQPKSAKPFFPFFPGVGDSDTMRKMHSDVVSSMPYSSAIQHASFAFNHVRSARQRLAVSTNVRGICQVRGFITFFGDRGRFRLEVVAYYLPTDNVFVGAVSVKSGYVVQDYKAWEKLKEKEKKQKEQRFLDNKAANVESTAKSAETSSTTSTTGEDKENND